MREPPTSPMRRAGTASRAANASRSAARPAATETTTREADSLNNVANLRLKYMNISGNNHSGIYGTTVNGFQLDRCNITGNGNTTTSNPDELGVDLYELTGSATNGPNPTSIVNTTISNNWEFELHVVNTTGTLTDFQINNCRIASDGASAVHGDLVSFLGQGSSNMKLNVSGGSFVGAAPATADAIFGNAGGPSMTVIVSGAAFTNNNVGVNVSTDPVSTLLTFNITNNTFTGGRAQAINQFNNGNPPFARTVNGRIQNNMIGTLGVAGSGSSVGRGIDVGNEGSVNVNLLISGNIIQEVTSFEGIGVNVGLAGLATGGGTNNLTITGNTIRNINGSRGLIVQDNQDTTGGGPFPTLFANISGNSFSGIAGQAGNGQFMRLKRLNGTVKVTQAVATAAAIAAELDDANGFNDPTKISVSGTVTFSAGTPSTPP